MEIKEDRALLGRRGEIFVLQKLFKLGWQFPENYSSSLLGVDWVLEKQGRTINIQVKATRKANPKFGFHRINFDYLIITNLNDCWIVPMGVLRTSNVLSGVYRKFCNKFELLEARGHKLLGLINDCGVNYSDIDSLAYFHREEAKIINA